MKTPAFVFPQFRRAMQLAAIVATGACGNNGTGPGNEDPGFVRVSVTGPATPNVAFKLRIAGGAVDSARVGGGTLFFETLGPALHRAIVVGTADRTRLLEFWMADRNLLDSLGVNIEEVAATGTYEQRSVAGYAAIVGR